jgi:hypothetical protein
MIAEIRQRLKILSASYRDWFTDTMTRTRNIVPKVIPTLMWYRLISLFL